LLVFWVDPHLGDPAIADVVDGHPLALEPVTPEVAGVLLEDDHMVLVRQDVVRNDHVRPLGSLREPGEDPKDPIAAPVLARQWSAARHMADEVLGQDIPYRREISTGQGRVRLPQELLVWMRSRHGGVAIAGVRAAVNCERSWGPVD
jgi:hypothetical protein